MRINVTFDQRSVEETLDKLAGYIHMAVPGLDDQEARNVAHDELEEWLKGVVKDTLWSFLRDLRDQAYGLREFPALKLALTDAANRRLRKLTT